ncbi:MAG: CpaF family protein [Candidatus Thiodiazotropha sp. (ex Dulcina madagascariensis)]|nr:CpaF family protein [Candidatus Thiodiazotropha sp. (ex Dulcina madagascariensis)]
MRFNGSNMKPEGTALASTAGRLSPTSGRLGSGMHSGLSQNEKEWKQEIIHRLVKMLDLPMLVNLSDVEARSLIRESCESVMAQESLPFNIPTRQRIMREIENEILGLGPLEQLLSDATISDILVNGPGQVYIERHGKLELSTVHFDSDLHLMTVIDRIVSRVGRRIDESSPMVDARLQDGSRVNVIIPPLAIDGPQLSIRRFSVECLTMEHLIALHELTPSIAKVLEAIVRARLNVLISGGTGSGKTTLLNVLSSFIPPDERIVTIEDSAELQLQQPHKVRLETRPPNIEGKGEVTQRDLVRNSLRMRPDRIIIGEVRGPEALDMLQAMNTGHDGSLTTIHANSARDAMIRVESMVAMSGIELPTRQVRGQISSALDIIIQLERQEDGVRRLTSIQEVQGLEGEVITLSEIFSFQRRGMDRDGAVVGDFVATGVVPKFQGRLRQRGLDIGLEVYEPAV